MSGNDPLQSQIDGYNGLNDGSFWGHAGEQARKADQARLNGPGYTAPSPPLGIIGWIFLPLFIATLASTAQLFGLPVFEFISSFASFVGYDGVFAWANMPAWTVLVCGIAGMLLVIRFQQQIQTVVRAVLRLLLILGLVLGGAGIAAAYFLN